MKIIEHRWTERGDTVELHFDNLNCPGAGWSFECDEAGNVDEDALPPAALANLNDCRKRMNPCGPGRIIRTPWSYTHPSVGQCDRCSAEVLLQHAQNTCRCGAWYNMAGQALRDPEYWGEETGETAADILGSAQANY